MEDCLGVLVPGPSDSVHLVAARAGSPPLRPSTAELLQQLPGDHFLWVLEAVLLAARAYLNHVGRCASVGQAGWRAGGVVGKAKLAGGWMDGWGRGQVSLSPGTGWNNMEHGA